MFQCTVPATVNDFSPQGGSRDLLGSDEPPSETKKFFEAILVGRGLNLVR